MKIQINAAARLNTAAQITAADAADAGKIVLWIQKATGWTGKKSGRAGKTESVTFQKKIADGREALGGTVCITVTLDHSKAGAPISIEGGIENGTSKKFNKIKWHVSEKTGRQTIVALKNELKQSIATLEDLGGPEINGSEALAAVLKKLVSAKSKVETE